MGRPERNNADYFTHKAHTRNERRVRAVRNRFGLMGYAVYLMLLEALTDADGNEVEWNETEQELLAGDFGVSVTEIRDVVSYCVTLGLANIDEEGFLLSEELNELLAPVYLKRKRARESSAARKRSQAGRFVSANNSRAPGLSATESPHSKGKESKAEESKGKQSKNSRPDSPPAPPAKKNELVEDAVLLDENDKPLKAQPAQSRASGTLGGARKKAVIHTDPEEFSFEDFWRLIHGARHGSKPLAVKAWATLTLEEKEAVKRHLPLYCQQRPDSQLRLRADRYLLNKDYLDPAQHEPAPSTTKPRQAGAFSPSRPSVSGLNGLDALAD